MTDDTKTGFTKDDWEFDEECPKCGESVHIGAIVEQSEGETGTVEMVCGTLAPDGGFAGPGCGHTWKYDPDS